MEEYRRKKIWDLRFKLIMNAIGSGVESGYMTDGHPRSFLCLTRRLDSRSKNMFTIKYNPINTYAMYGTRMIEEDTFTAKICNVWLTCNLKAPWIPNWRSLSYVVGRARQPHTSTSAVI